VIKNHSGFGELPQTNAHLAQVCRHHELQDLVTYPPARDLKLVSEWALASIVEAILGAVCQDGGMAAARTAAATGRSKSARREEQWAGLSGAFRQGRDFELSNLFFNQLFGSAGVKQVLALVKNWNASGDSAVVVCAQAASNDLQIPSVM
jgi:hypothetical protein